MELKTAKHFIDEASEFGGKAQTRDDIIKMMKEYALQEVKKHLEIASEEVTAYVDFDCAVIDRTSITNIKIELT